VRLARAGIEDNLNTEAGVKALKPQLVGLDRRLDRRGMQGVHVLVGGFDSLAERSGVRKLILRWHSNGHGVFLPPLRPSEVIKQVSLHEYPIADSLVDIDKHEKHGQTNLVCVVNGVLSLEPEVSVLAIPAQAQGFLTFQLNKEGDSRQAPGLHNFDKVILGVVQGLLVHHLGSWQRTLEDTHRQFIYFM
jgi:hypothetical protein